MPSSVEVRQNAWQLCVQGHFEEARRLLVASLVDAPDEADTWVLLAKLHIQFRDPANAMAAASRATQLDPGHVEGLYTLGRAHRLRGELPAAEQSYRRALALAPDHADILTSLGILLRARGQSEEAVRLYRLALKVNPTHAEAAHNLGNALAAQLSELRRTAEAQLASAKPQEALQTLSDALRIAPNDPELCLAIGKLECAIGRPQTGLQHIETAAQLAPRSIEAHEIARRICVAGGLYERAIHYSDRMLELAPTADIALAASLLLPCIQQSRDSIRDTRRRYRHGIAAALASDTPIEGPTSLLGSIPFFVASHTAFYLAYHGENNRDLQVELARMYLKRMPGLAMTAPHCLEGERRPGRLRVGFISRFLRNHSIGKTTRGLIDRLSRETFEVYALRITPSGDDEVTQAIRASADYTIDLHPDLSPARDQIAALQLDILFYQDIGMEQTSYFLAFARLAPVQCLSYGHPDTTGIPNMDYFVSNDLYETDDARAHYSEQLVCLHDLPTLAYYYKPPLPKLPVQREKFGFTATESLYLCPQTLFKLHPDFDALLNGILLRDPNGVVVLLDGAFAAFSDELRRRFSRTLPTVAHRVKFLPQLAYDTFLELLAVADVVLDTVHFNGMNTSLEAFALGTPVVTWPGEMQRGRHTQAMYRKMGVLDGIAASTESYIEIAVRIGTDRGYARSLRERILSNNAALYEDPRVVREFERFFLEAIARATPPVTPARPASQV